MRYGTVTYFCLGIEARCRIRFVNIVILQYIVYVYASRDVVEDVCSIYNRALQQRVNT